MSEIVETRTILLPDGNQLVIEMTARFFDEVRKKFMLLPSQTVTDDHVRMFIYGSVDSALKKHEGKE